MTEYLSKLFSLSNRLSGAARTGVPAPLHSFAEVHMPWPQQVPLTLREGNRSCLRELLRLATSFDRIPRTRWLPDQLVLPSVRDITISRVPFRWPRRT